ncbi:MAG: BatA and WFA domain-containing protein [Lacipirellulaceae bacterium]
MDSLFRNTLGPAAWTAIALVPPAIFALYFLKLRRTPVEVPSTYLWHRVIEDLRVNSLWQRLRKSLLLLLQILLVALAMLALLRPGWLGQRLEGEKFIFVIDNSASMNAEDVDGQSRLAIAKQKVLALIDQLESDMSAMVVTFSDRPDLAQEMTDNRRLLRQSVERIKPTARQTDVRGALELADGFANREKVIIEDAGPAFDAAAPEPVELFLFSDGRFGPVDDFSFGNLQPKYLPIGSFDAQNLAITSFNTRRSENSVNERQAFVQVANASKEDVKAVVEVYLDDALFDAAEVDCPAEGSNSYTFRLGEVGSGVLRAKLTPPSEFNDALVIDNTAYAVLDPVKDTRVLLVTPGNTTLEVALTTERTKRLAEIKVASVEEFKSEEFQRQVQAEVFDLIIFDQYAPEQMPPANTLFIGRIPPLPSWQEESGKEPVFGPQIIDWQRSHPLLNLVELGNVQIIDTLTVDPPPGGKVLIDSTKGPIAAIAPRGAYEDAVLGFELIGVDSAGNVNVNTNWPRSFSFTNFSLNTIEYLGGASQLQDLSFKPGNTVELDLVGAGKDLTITLPDGQKLNRQRPEKGQFSFHDTEQIGVYEIASGSDTIRRFAVNLFDRAESDIPLRVRQDDEDKVKTVESLAIGYVDVTAEERETPARKEIWQWLLMAVLAVLVLEWYIYNRRVYV